MTNEQYESLVSAAEAEAEVATKKAYLLARLAGVKSRYLSLDLPVPKGVEELKLQLEADVVAEKAEKVDVLLDAQPTK
jgi:hypothetical protein